MSPLLYKGKIDYTPVSLCRDFIEKVSTNTFMQEHADLCKFCYKNTCKNCIGIHAKSYTLFLHIKFDILFQVDGHIYDTSAKRVNTFGMYSMMIDKSGAP